VRRFKNTQARLYSINIPAMALMLWQITIRDRCDQPGYRPHCSVAGASSQARVSTIFTNSPASAARRDASAVCLKSRSGSPQLPGDMLNAEQRLNTTQCNLTQARHDTLPQGLKQKAAAGVLSEDNLATIDRMLGVRER
jgi:hypothetical protein